MIYFVLYGVIVFIVLIFIIRKLTKGKKLTTHLLRLIILVVGIYIVLFLISLKYSILLIV